VSVSRRGDQFSKHLSEKGVKVEKNGGYELRDHKDIVRNIPKLMDIYINVYGNWWCFDVWKGPGLFSGVTSVNRFTVQLEVVI